MKVTASAIPEVLLIQPEVRNDARGFFFESFNQALFQEQSGIDARFVQDSHSRSVKHVLRGLHYQIGTPQGKLVRAVVGEIFDVAVDVRGQSPSFGRWVGTILSADNKVQCWIPPGFAHGFLVLSDFAEVIYKATDYRVPALERGLLWSDADLHIEWPLVTAPLLSNKDAAADLFKNIETFL